MIYHLLVFLLIGSTAFTQTNQTKYTNGVSKLAKGDYAGAVCDFNAYAKANKKIKNAYFYLDRGRAYLGLNQPKEAIRDFETAAKLKPQEYEPRFQLGLAYKEAKNVEKARFYFQSIDTTAIRHFDAVQELGILCYQEKRFPEAEKFFTSLVSKYPQRPEGWYYRGAARLAQPNPNPDTCTDFRKAVDLGYEPAQAVWNRHCKP